MIKELGPGFRLTLVFTILTRTAVPGGDDRHISAYFSQAGERQPGHRQRKGCRFQSHRAELLQTGVLSSATFGGWQRLRRGDQLRARIWDRRARSFSTERPKPTTRRTKSSTSTVSAFASCITASTTTFLMNHPCLWTSSKMPRGTLMTQADQGL